MIDAEQSDCGIPIEAIEMQPYEQWRCFLLMVLFVSILGYLPLIQQLIRGLE